jgi:hypothetical protein
LGTFPFPVQLWERASQTITTLTKFIAKNISIYVLK